MRLYTAMDFDNLKKCVIGLYGHEMIVGQHNPSLDLYFNTSVPVLNPNTQIVRSVMITASESKLVNDPNVDLDTGHQVSIPKVTKYFPASIKIQFTKGDAQIISPILTQQQFIRSMMEIYPATLTINQLIAEADKKANELRIQNRREAEERRNQITKQTTIQSIQINKALLKSIVSEAIQISSQAQGCDIELVGKEAFLRSIREKVYSELISIGDTIPFP
jgi:hypothetical protein